MSKETLGNQHVSRMLALTEEIIMTVEIESLRSEVARLTRENVVLKGQIKTMKQQEVNMAKHFRDAKFPDVILSHAEETVRLSQERVRPRELVW